MENFENELRALINKYSSKTKAIRQILFWRNIFDAALMGSQKQPSKEISGTVTGRHRAHFPLTPLPRRGTGRKSK